MKWEKGTGFKKYKVTLDNGKVVQFGDTRYQQYKDVTPLRLYKHLDHNDSKRRDNYRKRHGANGYQLKKWTPSWFSWNYLW